MVIEPKTRVRLQFYLDESPLALSTLPMNKKIADPLNRIRRVKNNRKP